MTTKQPHSPQNRLREKAGGGVHLHTSLTNTAAIIPPSPCGGGDGGGVRPHASLINREPAIGWINAQRSAKTTTPFTYTNLATLYVNSPKTIGCALAHHRPNPATTAPFPTEQLPPPWGRAGVGAANTPRSAKKKFPLPCEAGEGWGFPLKKASAFFKGTRGGGVTNRVATKPPCQHSPFTYTLVATPYVNDHRSQIQHPLPHSPQSNPLPNPFSHCARAVPVPLRASPCRGGGVNITHSDKTTTSFTYANLATLYINDQ